jgi:hypothetical protein
MSESDNCLRYANEALRSGSGANTEEEKRVLVNLVNVLRRAAKRVQEIFLELQSRGGLYWQWHSSMPASAHTTRNVVLPIITCPTCRRHMRLCTIVPEENHRECMTFVCKCGFNYCQSNAVTVERGRQ